MKTFLTLQGQPDSIFYLPRKYLDHHIKFNILLYTTPNYMVTFKDFYLSVLGFRAKQKLKQGKKKKDMVNTKSDDKTLCHFRN